MVLARTAGILALLSAPLDTSSPLLSSTLLSAEEAKAQRREIVEGFFFRPSGRPEGLEGLTGDDRSTRKPTIISVEGGSDE